MTPLSKTREEELKAQCRDLFYEATARQIDFFNQQPKASLLDAVRGGHRLLPVLFGDYLTPSDGFLLPVRTYELLEELNHGTSSGS